MEYGSVRGKENGKKKIGLNGCIVWEQDFNYENNILKAQGICLDTEQSICYFKIHPDEALETGGLYIGKKMRVYVNTVWNPINWWH